MMKLGLDQKQTINLVMSPELRQAISLLQYSTLDLFQFIREQAIENPLIELEEKNTSVQFEEKYSMMGSKFYSRNVNTEDDYVSPLDFLSTKEGGLDQYLLEQVKWLSISEGEKSILTYLIYNIDENGYLPMSNKEIEVQLDISPQEAEHAIKLLQGLEPLGVGARNLKECLILQAQEYYPDESLVAYVIKNYLELLSEKKWKKISTELGISLLEVKKIYEYIQTLNPRPCSDFTSPPTNYLYPDISIEKKNGNYVISLNDSYLPNIHINQDYVGLISGKGDWSKYVTANYQKYLWLKKSIEQRRSTILKITEYIVENQQDFLDNGFSSIKAMTLKEVAESIEMHESTVSRAISNKVIQTPIGSFEMKRLFTSKLASNTGEYTSSVKVKMLLGELIRNEDKQKPYSDQKIADYLSKKHGITISRRTVAKYREELNILSSAKRKMIY